jgi:hypothetical protein
VHRLLARVWPDPTALAVERLDAKIERRCERIALATGRPKDAFQSWI